MGDKRTDKKLRDSYRGGVPKTRTTKETDPERRKTISTLNKKVKEIQGMDPYTQYCQSNNDRYTKYHLWTKTSGHRDRYGVIKLETPPP